MACEAPRSGVVSVSLAEPSLFAPAVLLTFWISKLDCWNACSSEMGWIVCSLLFFPLSTSFPGKCLIKWLKTHFFTPGLYPFWVVVLEGWRLGMVWRDALADSAGAVLVANWTDHSSFRRET